MLPLYLIVGLKVVDICVWNHSLMEHKAVQLVKDYMTEHAYGTAKFYLDVNDQWSYSTLIEHLITLNFLSTN